MANVKKKWVAFKSAAIIPAEMAGEDEDMKVQIGKPVHVPAFYADSVVQDRIADYCDAPKKKAAAKKPDAPTADEIAAAELVDLIAAAQLTVTEAQTLFDDAEGAEAIEAAELELTAAKDALAELQA